MTDYILMPEEATPEMEQAADKYWNDRKFKALSDDPRTWKGLYAAMRGAAPVERNQCDGCQAGIPVEKGIHRMGKPDGYADLMACTADRYGAAPDVQGEPTDDELLNWAAEEQLFLLCEDDDFLQIAREVLHKYGSRSPAVQGEPVARVKTVGGYLEVSEHVVEWLCKHKDLKDGDHLYLVQQPVEKHPDVTHMVEALETIVDLPIDPCSTENDYRLAAAKSIASAALAAHRRVTQP